MQEPEAITIDKQNSFLKHTPLKHDDAQLCRNVYSQYDLH
jgi:hypothetical protein